MEPMVLQVVQVQPVIIMRLFFASETTAGLQPQELLAILEVEVPVVESRYFKTHVNQIPSMPVFCLMAVTDSVVQQQMVLITWETSVTYFLQRFLVW